MRAFRKLGFDISYLALLTKDHIKPLSRWEGGFSRRQIKALRHLGLKTDTVERPLLNGHSNHELIFSTSSRYLDLYSRKFHHTPLRRDRQSVITEGFLFGYPGCCVRSFARNGYTKNELQGRGQEILFHWACPGCRATPELLPYYTQARLECQRLFDRQWPRDHRFLRASLPAAALSLLFALAPAKASCADQHWLSLGAADPDSNYLTYPEEVLLGSSEGFFFQPPPSGPREAQGFENLIWNLSTTPSNSHCYRVEVPMDGVENCQVCGEEMTMGGWNIHNPMQDTLIFVPNMALHFMEHGSFSFDGTTNAGRIDIELLKRMLAHYDIDHYAITTTGDADGDGLKDEYEDDFGTLTGNPDSNDNGLVDGAEVARQLVEAISELPSIYWGQTPPSDSIYVEYNLAAGLETCEFCGMEINMGDARIVNTAEGMEDTVNIVGLHYMAHGRLAYNVWGHHFEIDAPLLAKVLGSIQTSTPPPGKIPKMHGLSVSNYPNPFNAGTQIRFSVPETSRMTLRIYNIKGQLVRSLLDETVTKGHHRIRWNGQTDDGALTASGVYFCRLEHNGMLRTTKMLLLK